MDSQNSKNFLDNEDAQALGYAQAMTEAQNVQKHYDQGAKTQQLHDLEWFSLIVLLFLSFLLGKKCSKHAEKMRLEISQINTRLKEISQKLDRN